MMSAISEERVWRSETEEMDEDVLFALSMQKKWDEVAKLYQEHGEAVARVILTKTRDTALHVAVSSYNAKAEYHIRAMIHSTPPQLLCLQNDKGNTPLHLAAAVGWQEMCTLISSTTPDLIYVRNLENQTPLFVAAHHGNLEAFRCLHEVYTVSHCRGGQGNTILHSAISADNFGTYFFSITNYSTHC